MKAALARGRLALWGASCAAPGTEAENWRAQDAGVDATLCPSYCVCGTGRWVRRCWVRAAQGRRRGALPG